MAGSRASNGTFIFGYGSLICADSRARSGHSGACIPVVVSGLLRSWSAEIKLGEVGAVPTAMMPNSAVGGVTAVSVASTDDPSVQCNGVIVAVDEADMPKFDEREVGYRRELVPLERVALLHGAAADASIPADAQVWVYVADGSAGPSGGFPIIQSYVDVILLGAAQISPAFLEQFVRTTSLWEGGGDGGEGAGAGAACVWLDDRHAPAYVRADASASARGAEFDEVLARLVPGAFARRGTAEDGRAVGQ